VEVYLEQTEVEIFVELEIAVVPVAKVVGVVVAEANGNAAVAGASVSLQGYNEINLCLSILLQLDGFVTSTFSKLTSSKCSRNSPKAPIDC